MKSKVNLQEADYLIEKGIVDNNDNMIIRGLDMSLEHLMSKAEKLENKKQDDDFGILDYIIPGLLLASVWLFISYLTRF